MSFKTPFIADNQPGALHDFGFFKIQRHTKSAIIGMLENFFDSINNTYKIQIPEIVGVQNSSDVEKVFVTRDFPYKERKLPMILVAIKSATERKMYIGADNLVGHIYHETSTGDELGIELYHGAADISLALIVIALSPEERMQLTELVTLCFTHYYRWQYFYTLGDGNVFSVVPNTAQLEFGSESEVTDVSPESLLYLTDITMKSFIEYTFKDFNVLGSLKDYTIDDSSGPQNV